MGHVVYSLRPLLHAQPRRAITAEGTARSLAHSLLALVGWVVISRDCVSLQATLVYTQFGDHPVDQQGLGGRKAWHVLKL
jgi:hypothetical protein